MQSTMDRINEEIAVFQRESALFEEKGNKAAGKRARKSSLALGKMLKEFRAQSTGR